MRRLQRHSSVRFVAAVAIAACHSVPTPAPVPNAAPSARPVTPPAPPSATVPTVQLQGQPPIATLDAHHVIPVPSSVIADSGAPFTLARTATIVVSRGNDDVARVGEALARQLRPSTGFRLAVSASDSAAPAGAIVLRLGGADSLGTEGYALAIGADSVRITATTPAGLFHGMQTLRQLLPPIVEAEQFVARAPIPWTVPAGRIVDRPRFAYRSAMLDVARHFFTVDEVEQFIDILALYKLNTLHLGLANDQGWRIEIKRRPKLTAVGGLTEVGGRGGGFYTQRDYAELVRFAQERYVTIVPEIDMPAHTQAAIAAYPEIGCGRARPDTSLNVSTPDLYAGIGVGFSALCPDRKETYRFVDDVVRELAAMTPGPYLHMGGDEVAVLSREQYATFITRVQDIVATRGKRMIGWDEIGHVPLRPGTVAQMWRIDTTMAAAKQGAKLVISPGPRAYLDMKYGPATELGLRWAGFIELRSAYEWDPVTHFPRATENDVLGVEGALWSETIRNITAAEYLAMPRLPAIAEVAWSSARSRDWEGFRTRIAAHAARWRLMGVNYYASPQVSWQ